MEGRASLFEHTWGAWNSVSDSENPFVTKQWDFKRNFAVDAEKMSKSLIDEVLRSYATGNDASMVDIHNSSSWSRTEVVVLSKEMSSAGDHVKDEHGMSVPSQRLSSGELAFLAQDVPAFGGARFHLSSAKPHTPRHMFPSGWTTREWKCPREVDATSGNIIPSAARNPDNLVDGSRGEAVNEFLFLEGKRPQDTAKGPCEDVRRRARPVGCIGPCQSAAPGAQTWCGGLPHKGAGGSS
jgi:hypothetical protein